MALIAICSMPLKITVGKDLQLQPCERGAEWVNLGVVSEARNYKKRNYIEVCTDKGWYTVEVDAGLESVMTDFIDIAEI